MRNGNCSFPSFSDSSNAFLPYLWGMETRFFRPFCPWPPVLTVPMRNGNEPTIYVQDADIGFLPYLWGMETLTPHRVTWHWHLFLPYLWGMETDCRPSELVDELGSYRTYEEWKHGMVRREFAWKASFLPYLWGMETCYSIYIHRSAKCVLTVPMRNGNSMNKRYFNTALLGSYRTYEEWKLISTSTGSSVGVSVLTVPMRNGNHGSILDKDKAAKFLPYLWGMETW